jgi:hypothetical protein
LGLFAKFGKSTSLVSNGLSGNLSWPEFRFEKSLSLCPCAPICSRAHTAFPANQSSPLPHSPYPPSPRVRLLLYSRKSPESLCCPTVRTTLPARLHGSFCHSPIPGVIALRLESKCPVTTISKESYCVRPMRRSNSLKRGSECRGSNRGSALRLLRVNECSSYALSSHAKVLSLSPRPA